MRIRSSLIAAVVAGLIVPVGAAEAALSAKARPTAPSIAKIVSMSKGDSLAYVTVTITLPKTHKAAPLLGSTVKLGSKTCSLLKRRTQCTVVVSRDSTVVVSARSRNKNGFGSWSSKVSFVASIYATWTKGQAPVTTTTVPPVKVNTSQGKVLQTQTAKWTRFQAFKSASVKAQSNRVISTMSVSNPAVVFGTSQAIGLAAPDDTTSGSGLLAVTSAGTVSEAMTTGSAKVQQFYTAPNGRFYVLFQQKTALVSGGAACLLAEVIPSTGIPICIDESLSSIWWSSSSSTATDPVQFDAQGNIYYQGVDSGTKTSLRRYSAGVRTDLVNDNVTVSSFMVLDDGSVIYSGTTRATQAKYVRRITTTGGVETLVGTGEATFIRKFADGNIYMGVWSNDNNGVLRFLTSTGTMDSKAWIAGSLNNKSQEATNSISTLCPPPGSSATQSFCGWYGAYLMDSFNLKSGVSVALTGSWGTSNKQLYRYTPDVARITTSLSGVTIAREAGNVLALTGLNAAGKNITSLYDPSNNQETVVIDAATEIELYNLTYVASTNKLMFNGLRFADNKYVVGEISLG